MDFDKQLSIILMYMGMSEEKCLEHVINYLKSTTDEEGKIHVKTIKRVFDEENKTRSPHPKTRAAFSKVLSDIAKKEGIVFKNNWLDKGYDLSNEKELKPYAHSNGVNISIVNNNFLFFQSYHSHIDRNKDAFEKYVNNYCRDQLIYRRHSTGVLVREVLRISKYRDYTAECTYYKYLENTEDKYKVYIGNIFISRKNNLYIVLTKSDPDTTVCPEFLFMTFNNEEILEKIGVISGIGEVGASPVSALAFMTAKCDKKLEPNSLVGAINEDDKSIHQSKIFSKFIKNKNNFINTF